MSQDIVTLYVSLLSAFFTLSSSTHSPNLSLGAASTDPNATPPLPPFVPPNSNAAANCHWLLKTLNELTECVSELAALELAGEASASLKELVASTRWRFEEAICSSWVRGEFLLLSHPQSCADCPLRTDAKVFYRLETWIPDPDEPSTTAYLRNVAAFQRFCTISAYRVAGGTEERANALMSSTATGGGSKGRQEPVSGFVFELTRRAADLGLRPVGSTPRVRAQGAVVLPRRAVRLPRWPRSRRLLRSRGHLYLGQTRHSSSTIRE